MPVDPVVMSSSSLSELLSCGLKWKYRHVLKLPSPPSVRTVIGNATHSAVERNLGQKIVSTVDLPMDDVLDTFSTAFDKEALDIEKPEEPIGQGKDSGVKLVKLHHIRVAPTITPLAVEQQLQFTIGGKHYNTFADALEQRPDGIGLRELKTTARQPDPKSHLFQMIGAALGFRFKWKQKEADNRMDFLIRNKIPRYAKVLWGGPVDDPAIRVFSQQVEYANKMISAGLFMANGIQNHVCGYCSYTAICPAYKAVYGKAVVNS